MSQEKEDYDDDTTTLSKSNKKSTTTTTTKTTIVTFETTVGIFKAELYTNLMPITCGNFIDLVDNYKYYDGLYLHRITPNYCIQFGCPYAINPHVYYGTLENENVGHGSGPPNTEFKSSCCSDDKKIHTRDEYGNIEDEFVKNKVLSNVEGTLSMANSGEPDTGGSQFFINLKDNTHLDWFNGDSESAHPVFGKIIDEGMDIIKMIENVELNVEQPVTPIQMKSVTVAVQ